MVYKLYHSVYKEMLLLKRDFGGVIILFLMPLVLIISVTLIQDSSFKKTTNSKIPILFVDNDKGKVSHAVVENLQKSEAFSIITSIDNQPITEQIAQKLVFKGNYQMAIVIPSNLSTDLQLKIDQNVEKIVSQFSVDETKSTQNSTTISQKEVKLYFDPAVQLSFKNGVMNAIDKLISQIETQSIYAAFQDQLGDGVVGFEQKNFISFKEIVPHRNNQEVIPNATQHNVPAWTLFAIFFIVIPLSINIVKEKLQGTFVRLQTNPVSNIVIYGGKIIVYLLICLLQFYMMIGVAIFIFPNIGLPPLNLDGNLFLMSLVAFFSGLAAIGFGILLGTVAKTQEQSAPFGATATIILAAIGGVWVPVFAMSETMQIVSKLSPMNWGLNAFSDVLLRNGSFIDILPEISLLLLFFITTTTIALYYDKKKRAV